MLDYLDSILNQSTETAPVLRPRTPSVFETVPNGYGPDDRFGPLPRFSATSPQDPLTAQTERTRDPIEPPRNTVQTIHEISPEKEKAGTVDDLLARLSRQRFRVSQKESGENVFPGEPLLKPISSVAIPPRLNELDVMTQKARSALLSSPIEQTSTANHPLQPRSIVNPVSMNDKTARLVPYLSEVKRPAEIGELGEPPKMRDSNELPERVFSQKPNVDLLKQMDEKLETLRPKPVGLPMTHSIRAPFLSANSYSQPEQGRSMPNIPPLQIHVNIRQVEVRAAAAPPPPRPEASRGATPTSLEDYLKRMNGGSR